MDFEDENDHIDDQAPKDDKVRRRKTPFTWKTPHDLALAKLVQEKTPFNQPRNRKTKVWAEVASEINSLFKTNINGVGASRRYEKVMEFHRKKETKKRNASGKEEEVTELDEVLTSLIDVEDDFKLCVDADTDAKQKKVDDQKGKAKEIRAAALTTMKSPVAGAPQKRVTETSLLSLYMRKQEKDFDMKRQKTDFEIRKLEQEKEENEKKRELKLQEIQLQRDEFEHRKRQEEEELKLRKKQADAQEEERKSQLKTQETLLQLLLKKL